MLESFRRTGCFETPTVNADEQTGQADQDKPKDSDRPKAALNGATAWPWGLPALVDTTDAKGSRMVRTCRCDPGAAHAPGPRADSAGDGRGGRGRDGLDTARTTLPSSQAEFDALRPFSAMRMSTRSR